MRQIHAPMKAAVKTRTFEDDLKRDGFADIETKSVESNKHVGEHSHPFDVRAKVLAGEITLTHAGASRTYRAGDVFSMEAGCKHAEQCGPAGVTYTVGRKHKAAS
jgi:quercetin dioxygenase-like cupin family protein